MEKTGKVSSDDERELDLSKYSTVDEVGEDDDDEEQQENKEEGVQEEPEEEEESVDTGEDINVGSEHVKQVETNYCELCFTYISHRGDTALNLKRHCASRSHLKYYIRYKDDLMLKEEAEALHKIREAEKKKKEAEKAKKEAENEKLNGSKDGEEKSDDEDKADDEGSTAER